MCMCVCECLRLYCVSIKKNTLSTQPGPQGRHTNFVTQVHNTYNSRGWACSTRRGRQYMGMLAFNVESIFAFFLFFGLLMFDVCCSIVNIRGPTVQ